MVDDDPQEKIVILTIPQRVQIGETFNLSGNLLSSQSDVRDIELYIQTRQNGGKWENLGETMTDMDGRFESNLKAPTNKGIYELRAFVPKNRLYIGGAYDTKTIAVDNHNSNSGTFIDTLYKWAPVIGMASIGVAMIGLSTYRGKDKSSESEENRNGNLDINLDTNKRG